MKTKVQIICIICWAICYGCTVCFALDLVGNTEGRLAMIGLRCNLFSILLIIIVQCTRNHQGFKYLKLQFQAACTHSSRVIMMRLVYYIVEKDVYNIVGKDFDMRHETNGVIQFWGIRN